MVVGDFDVTTVSGGIHIDFGDDPSDDPVEPPPQVTTTARLHNSIVWGNIVVFGDQSGRDVFTDNHVIFRVRASNVGAAEGNTLLFPSCISANPMFKSAAAADYRLELSSPCVDTGIDALIGLDFCDLDDHGDPDEDLPRDLDNIGRLADIPGAGATEIVDMGAYETPVP